MACQKETANEFEHRISDGAPSVDLLIRTGGHQRLSDFMLWECAFAELYFTKTLWPDFGFDEMHQVFSWFYTQKRNFGN